MYKIPVLILRDGRFPKFIALLTIIYVVPAAVVGLRTIAINREGMQAAILELHTNLASSLAEMVDSSLLTLERELQYIARTVSTQMAWKDRQMVLQALLDANQHIVSIAIVNRNGRELLKAYNPALEKYPRLIEQHTEPVFQAYRKSSLTTLRSDVYAQSGPPRMDMVVPVDEEHCLYAVISLQSLWNRITTTRIARTGFAFLVDGNGAIIAHPDPSTAAQHHSAMHLPIVSQAVKAVSVGSCQYRHPDTGMDIVGAYAPVRRLHWGLIIQQDKSEAFVSVTRMQRQSFLLIALSAAVVVICAIFIARGLTRPITALTNAAAQVARKDFSPRVAVTTGDELQDLAETFNTMTTELSRYDRLRVDEVLEEKTKTEAVFFSISDGILMLDSEGKLQVANDHAKRLLDLPKSNWQNWPLLHFVKNPELRELVVKILADPAGHARQEVSLSFKGSLRHYLLSTEQVVTPTTKEKIGLVTVFRDITLEKELDRMKEDFLHSITHDLRNPMTSIRGFLKFLQDEVAGPLTPQQHKMLNTMDRASHRLLGLINDILDIAKLESGTLSLTLGDADFRSLAQRNMDILEALALRKSITMTIDAPDNLPLISADPELIERVFGNLINNALKFTPEQGTITVLIRDEGDRIVSSVKDTGEGIPAAFLDRIFQKFQQVDGQHRGGTGLGLTICKHIIEAHGGTISVASEVGVGTTFTFSVPKGLTLERLTMEAQR